MDTQNCKSNIDGDFEKFQENTVQDNGLDIYNWKGVSDLLLQSLITDAETYRQILNGNNLWYTQELLNLFVCAKKYLELVKKSGFDDKQMHIEEEMLLHKLVSKIWVLSNHFGKDTYNVKTWNSSIHWRMDIDFKMWKNCVLAPWCLPNLNKLIKLNIIDQDNIDINLWDWVNLQEWISFIKTTWELWSYSCWKFEENDYIEKILIKTWKSCSFPHWASFYPWERSDIVIECWKWVFLWINTLIWSWAKIWNNSTIWWGTQLWNNVELWDNVIVGQSSLIESNIVLPDNCLIQNFSKIKKGYMVVKYEDYEKNPNIYVWNRNYIILLSNNDNERIKQINFINPHYNFINWFNRHNVVPENKVFAAIDTIFNFLYEKIWFQPINIFQYQINFENLKQKLLEKNISIDIIDKLNFWLDWKSRVILKAYPKDTKEFMLEEMIIILSSIIEYDNKSMLEEKKNELLCRIEKLVDRPIINNNGGEICAQDLEENFFWDCYITWKFKYSSDSIFIDLKSRGDELRVSEWIYLKNVAFVRWIIHWGWEKNIINSNLYDLVAHGWVFYKFSHIWEIWKKSVLNSCNVLNTSILWDATINSADINHSILMSEVSIAGWASEDKVIIQNSWTWKGVCINIWTEIYWKKIDNWEKLWKRLILTSQGISVKR